ncbi:hypothetical protein CLOM_g20299 [Closterium sp. NIES-68]|nr:hypothetical protein CLOM_g20299 [Closterium sp. NIES-68]GJP62165.1 hypothetical protein CLOP_g19257 [Closterium sp. NIES-67]
MAGTPATTANEASSSLGSTGRESGTATHANETGVQFPSASRARRQESSGVQFPPAAQNGNRRAEDAPAAAPSGVPPGVQFPPAAQPEVMRAAEKDELYAASLGDMCHDVIGSQLGHRVAGQWGGQIRMAARCLYYLVTTGAGSRTLGEEYCDILQVSGSYNLPPTPARRLSLVLLHALLPAMAAHISARAAVRGRALAAAGEAGFGSSGDSRSGSDSSSGAAASGAGGAASGAGAMAVGVNWWRQWMQQVREGVRAMGRRALVVWAGVAARGGDVVMLLGRAHLLLFYWHGTYLHLAKRATGVRYIYTAQPPAYSPRYHMLAFFLFIQLAILSSDWLRRSLLQQRPLAHPLPLAGPQPVLDAPAESSTGWSAEEASQESQNEREEENEASGRCSLCLATRCHPTCCPCGHIFCWGCIAEWCNEKPECPLCRSPAPHSSLVPLHHAAF